MRTLTLLMAFVAISAVAPAQAPTKPSVTAPQANPLTDFTKLNYLGGKMEVLLSAEKVPADDYSFKPTDAVRSFGEILGHVADTQYAFCSVVRGEKSPQPKIEKTKSSKADLIVALQDAFAYCDKAYDGMTDASGIEMVRMMGMSVPRLGILISNNQHISLHYGNLITYMRLKNIVPPSSDPAVLRRMQQMIEK